MITVWKQERYNLSTAGFPIWYYSRSEANTTRMMYFPIMHVTKNAFVYRHGYQMHVCNKLANSNPMGVLVTEQMDTYTCRCIQHGFYITARTDKHV